MHEIGLTLVVAAGAGVLAMICRVPPLVGFLVAGFVLGFAGTEPFPGLEVVADIGVVLLLFSIGLKLDVRALARREAWGTASVHMIVFALVAAGFIGLLSIVGLSALDAQWQSLVLVGFALSFSSTVLCVKVLQDRSDDGSYYGQTAIAILVFQDLAAVGFVTATGEEPPSPWALLLVLLLPAAWLLGGLLERVGHGEMLVLLGAALALGPGYWLFSSLGIKGDLGALVVGLLLAGQPVSGELSRALFSVKELFLVGFFLTIGMDASPTWVDVGLAVLLCLVLLPVKAAAFIALGRAFGLRNRTATMMGLVLGNFSEFALIVSVVGVSVGVLDEQELVVVAVAVALSMTLSSLLNGRGRGVSDRVASWLPAENPRRIRPADRPIETGDAQVVVLGLGRVGRSAYDEVREQGRRVVGIDNDHAVVERLRAQGYDVLEGDATDQGFWERVAHSGTVDLVILAMPAHDSNAFALTQLERSEFDGRVAAVAQHADQVQALTERGVRAVFNLYEGAGVALADAACADLRRDRGH